MTARDVAADQATHQRKADLTGMTGMAVGNVLLIVNDTLVKVAASHLPMSQVIFLRAVVAATFLLSVYRYTAPSGAPWPAFSPALLWRALLEAGTSFSYLYALQLLPIGDLAGLQQITPLVLLAGAAVVFRERIGWQGWLAAAVGLFGALLIVRPAAGGSMAAMLNLGAALALIAVALQVGRDLLTRALPAGASPAFVAGTSQLAMITGGLLLAPFDAWTWPQPVHWAEIAGAALFLGVANLWLVTAMRSGRLSVVAPFRYAGLLAALAAGWFVWGEFPDKLSLLGSAIITASGLYSLRRGQTSREEGVR